MTRPVDKKKCRILFRRMRVSTSGLSAGAFTRTAGFSLDKTNEIVSIYVKINYKIINCQGQVAI
jgi:hypothetical protein